MTDLADRLHTKAASDDGKKAQEARAKKYGIGIKDGGNVTKPGKYAELSDDDFADPTNYSYPLDTKAHADNAASRFGDADNRAVYTKEEQGIIDKRIAAAQKKFGEDGKGADMARLIKGTGGDVEVSESGTHASYTGTHTHRHKAFGSQGDDEQHQHEHEHQGDAKHDHTHPKALGKRPVRKALDFTTALTIVAADDTLQDEWGDSFQALVNALHSVLYQGYLQAYLVNSGDESFDAQAAADTVLKQFSAAMSDLVKRSLAADFCPSLDDDGDSFLDPDGPNAVADDEDDWKSRKPLTMPAAPPALRKAGRQISGANRKVITDALDGMSEAMKSMQSHHGAIADLMTKTDPDAVRQDEDNTQGDDDTQNGGTNPNKSRAPRRTAAEAGTTHQGWNLAALDADLDALHSRLKATGGKA